MVFENYFEKSWILWEIRTSHEILVKQSSMSMKINRGGKRTTTKKPVYFFPFNGWFKHWSTFSSFSRYICVWSPPWNEILATPLRTLILHHRDIGRHVGWPQRTAELAKLYPGQQGLILQTVLTCRIGVINCRITAVQMFVSYLR